MNEEIFDVSFQVYTEEWLTWKRKTKIWRSLFSGMAANSAKKAGFIYSAIYFIETYNFDGVDLEWYYPEPNDKVNNFH